MTNIAKAKDQLDKILRKSRVHFYKPLQIAEILHRHRTKSAKFSFDDLDFYRTRSKAWRDEVSRRAYIYLKMSDKLKDIVEARNFLIEKGARLNIEDFIGFFERKPGLKRSVDKAYEICVYVLFSAIVRLLKVELTMRYDSSNKQAIADFKEFIASVLGINGNVKYPFCRTPFLREIWKFDTAKQRSVVAS